MKYGIWLDEWFCNYIRPSSKRRTCERYSEIIEKRLKVKLGEYELDELTPLVLQRYITELIESGNMKTGKGLAANSVNGIITVIQNSLKLAYALGTIKEYAADKIRRPKTKEKEVTCFTLSEQKKIERAALAGKKTKWLGISLCTPPDPGRQSAGPGSPPVLRHCHAGPVPGNGVEKALSDLRYV